MQLQSTRKPGGLSELKALKQDDHRTNETALAEQGVLKQPEPSCNYVPRSARPLRSIGSCPRTAVPSSGSLGRPAIAPTPAKRTRNTCVDRMVHSGLVAELYLT